MFTIVSAADKVGAIAVGGPDSHNIDPRALWAAIIVAVVAAFAEGWSLNQSANEAHRTYAVSEDIIEPDAPSDIELDDDDFDLPRFWVETKSADLTSVIASGCAHTPYIHPEARADGPIGNRAPPTTWNSGDWFA